MSAIDEVKVDKDHWQSESLLEGSRENEDGDSNDSDSTVMLANQLRKKGLLNHSDQQLRGRGIILLLMTFLCILLLAVCFLLVWLVSLRRSHHHGSDGAFEFSGSQSYSSTGTTVSPGITSCGSTSSEAIAAGCHFDTFSFGWTPPECTDIRLYNTSVSTLRSRAGNSPIFFTPTHDILPFSALKDYATGNSPPGAAVKDHHEIHSTWEHYLTGCAYAWQKVQRAAARGWPLEEWSASYALAKRCGPDLLTREKQEGGSVTLHLKPWFPACGLTAEDMRKEVAAAVRS
ncbi:MAG: hypothetical protein LQ346_009062 [Caloplaca aetnensis]|nr:MAG: hypothetical protein LQ346_009062 [Caloplaca aetnensis]